MSLKALQHFGGCQREFERVSQGLGVLERLEGFWTVQESYREFCSILEGFGAFVKVLECLGGYHNVLSGVFQRIFEGFGRVLENFEEF